MGASLSAPCVAFMTAPLTFATTTPPGPALATETAFRTPRDSIWLRIAQELAEAIGQGRYEPGTRLPSEHSLAEQFGVHRHTVRRALASLGQQGLVRVSQGSGAWWYGEPVPTDDEAAAEVASTFGPFLGAVKALGTRTLQLEWTSGGLEARPQ